MINEKDLLETLVLEARNDRDCYPNYPEVAVRIAFRNYLEQLETLYREEIRSQAIDRVKEYWGEK